MKHQDFIQYIEENEIEFYRYIMKKAAVGSWVRDNLHDLARLDEPMIIMWGMEQQWQPGQWVPFEQEMLPMISGLSKKDETKLVDVFSGRDPSNLFTIQHKINRPDGIVKSCEVRIEVHSRDNTGFPVAITGVNIDTTDLIIAQEKAYYDQLTKIYNRTKLYDSFTQGIQIDSQSSGCLIVMLDLDRFKEINDRHGHRAGDLTLGVFTKTLASNIGVKDKLFRLGGDEFVIIAPDISFKDSHCYVEMLLEKTALITRPFKISSSIGAVHLTEQLPLTKALSLVDKELYKVKHNNPGGYSISPF